MESVDSKSELSHHEHAITVQKLAEENEIELDEFISTSETKIFSLNDEMIVLGMLYVSVDYIRNNPNALLNLIGLIKDHYASTHLRSDVSLSVLVEDDDGQTTEVDYEGPADEIDGVMEQVRLIKNEESDD